MDIRDLLNQIKPYVLGWTGGYTAGTWTPTFPLGFSTPPEPVCQYFLIGKLCMAMVTQGTLGVSNSSAFRMTLPFTAASVPWGQYWRASAVIWNNSVTPETHPGLVAIQYGTAFANIYMDFSGINTFSTSGFKGAAFEITYEIE